MQVFKLLGLLLLAGALGIVAMMIYETVPHFGSAGVPTMVISNFEECAAAGNPVMESYPRQCRTEDGRLFVEDAAPGATVPSEEVPGGNRCAVAGCSQQLCVRAEEAPTIITTCEYRAEYACYAQARCEVQPSGECGWTPTPELQACLASPPGLDETELQVM